MSHFDLKTLRYFFTAVMFSMLMLSGCTSGDKCSADSQCKGGYYCGSGEKCVEFLSDDYTIVFQDLVDGQNVDSGDDKDTSNPGIQIDVALKLDTKVLPDNMDVTLRVTGSRSVDYKGSFKKNRAVFSDVTVPYGSAKLDAFLVQNPDVKTRVNLSVKQVDIVPSYLKGGKTGTLALLDGAAVVDADDYDSATVNGIQLYLVAQTEGIAEGETVVIFVPEVQDEVFAEGTVDAEGKVDFKEVTIPILKTIRMSFVNGNYKKSVEFTLETKEHCGFLVNLQNNAIFGIDDDKDKVLKDLQYDLTISEIAGCASGSSISIFIDSDGSGTPSYTAINTEDFATKRITLSESSSLEDTRRVYVKIEDKQNGLFGTANYEGVLVDLTKPTVEVTNPEVGAILNMDDDIEPATAGLQINFEGTSTDSLTKPVDVTLTLGETVIETAKNVDGQYSVPYSFAQSYETLVLSVEATDGAGNTEIVNVPFSVKIDTEISFQSICGKTGADIVPGMYLNAQDDENTSADLLQCTVILKLADGSVGNAASLKVGGNDAEKRNVGADNTVTFNIELPESSEGITLVAKAFQDDDEKAEISQNVLVDTIAPEPTLSNNLFLNSGDVTSAVNLTFIYSCSESCSYNGLLDSETGDVYSSEAERILTGLAGGTHVFTLRAKDHAGNISEPVVFNWTVDNEAPETVITSDPGAGTSDNFAFFTFETTTPETGVKFWCKLEKDGANFIPADDSFEVCNMGVRDYYGLADGNYRFLVKAEDGAGNIDPSPAEHFWIVGTEAPVTTIDSIAPAATPANSKDIVFTYSASITSTFECKLEKNGSVEIDWTDCSSGERSYSSLDDGTYLFSVRATSITGVKEERPVSYSWRVDTSAPKVKILSKPAKLSPYNAATFLFKCSGELEVCSFACEFDSTPVSCATGYFSYAGETAGEHRFTVTATDAAGNVSVAVNDDADPFQNDYTWEINPLALGVEITSDPGQVNTSKDASFSFGSNKAATFECKMDEGAYTPCSSPADYTDLAEGEHKFSVKASFAEEIAFVEHVWTIDSINPTVTIDSKPADPSNETGAIFYFSADETAVFECKLESESVWSSCVSPKVYPSGTFGISGSTVNHTFSVRATDIAGNSGIAEYSWDVDLEVPTITWVSPGPGTYGKVSVGKADNVFGNDPVNYAVRITVKVAGSNLGQPISVKGFKTPPGYQVVNVDSLSEKTYQLTVGLESGARINNPLTISVLDDSGNSASVSHVVVVNTEEPTITWASPANYYKFLSTTSAPKFMFNVWNALPGTTIELVNSDTDVIIATGETVGSTGIQEYVTLSPVLDDRCAPYKLHATFVDPESSKRYYTNSTDDPEKKVSRSFIVDRKSPEIVEVTIPGVDAADRILNRADNLNIDPDGGMKTDITVNISDTGNSSDTNRVVRILTNNGTGEPLTLLGTLSKQGNTAVFEKIALNECSHTIKVEVTDCSGNVATRILPQITVDTVVPELTVSAPRGSGSNWRWLAFNDDPALGTIDGAGNFTNIDMIVNSNEDLGSYAKVIHTSYDYDNSQNYQNDISSLVVFNTDSITIPLPDLEYAKHRFEVTVEDAAGNMSTIGNGSQDIYEVDVIVPGISFNNMEEGDSFYPNTNLVKLDVYDVGPQSSYILKAIPIVSQGGAVDSTRFEKEWPGSVSVDGTISKSIQIGNGWWRFSATIKDDHDNVSATGEIDVNMIVPDPSVTLKKGFNYAPGEGPAIQGDTVENPAWMVPEDIECTGDNCGTDIEVWTDAPAGSTAYIKINADPEVSKVTVPTSGQSYADFSDVVLDKSLEYNTIVVKVVSTTLAEVQTTHYIKVDETSPTLALISPVCTGAGICRRKDLADDPLTTDVIELAELGYGYADDAVSGDVLNFKADGAIKFVVNGAVGGLVEIEAVSGVGNRSASISYDSVGDYYYADFTTLTAADSVADGQTDYDLVFKVTEQPSGAVSRYLIRLHVDLAKPSVIDISGAVSTFKKEGRVEIDWTAISGNSSAFGDTPGAVYRYDVRYQDYNEGSCNIATSFINANVPLETYAGAVPDPVVSGNMSYEFFVNRIDNGLTGENLIESDTHRNGNKYCFAVAAVDAVYASDGTVLAENVGAVLPEDTGEMKMNWTNLRAANPLSHLAVLRNLGDLDGDGLDDFVIADGYKSSDGLDDDYAGQIEIVFSGGVMTFVKTGAAWQSLGQGVSSKADFNGDGYLDLAYTDYYGDVFIHYGGETGLNSIADVTFTANGGDDVFRTIATGDYNGDGCDDIAVSAPEAYGSGILRGEIYVYYGRGESCSSSTAIDGSVPDVEFEGAADNDHLGRGEIYSVGDLDGDGKTDFVFTTNTNVVVIYGGDAGGEVSYTITGMQSSIGRRIGYGNFNGDGFSDLVLANKDEVLIYFGRASGISSTPSIVIDDIGTVNRTYPPSVTNFATTVSPENIDINGDSLTDLIVASDRGLLVYQTHSGGLIDQPAIFDPFIDSSSTFIKALMIDRGVVYCDNATDAGSCDILKYGD